MYLNSSNQNVNISYRIRQILLYGWLVYFVTNIRYAARLSVYTVT